jgi:hypothetical protein
MTHRVKMSLVTTPRLKRSRRARHSASSRAVFPDPTGLPQQPLHQHRAPFAAAAARTHPPMPTVNARSFQLRPS